jgi:hypothetical protein
LAKIACGDFRGVQGLGKPTRPAKNVVFAGVPTLSASPGSAAVGFI